MFKLGVKSSSLQLCTKRNDCFCASHHCRKIVSYNTRFYENGHVSVAYMIRLSVSYIYNAAFDIVQRKAF